MSLKTVHRVIERPWATHWPWTTSVILHSRVSLLKYGIFVTSVRRNFTFGWPCISVQFLRITNLTQILLTCICLTAGVNLLTPSGHRHIRDFITTGIDMCGRRMRKGGGRGMDHTSVTPLTNQLCSDRCVVRVFEYSINVLYYKYGRNQSWRY